MASVLCDVALWVEQCEGSPRALRSDLRSGREEADACPRRWLRAHRGTRKRAGEAQRAISAAKLIAPMAGHAAPKEAATPRAAAHKSREVTMARSGVPPPQTEIDAGCQSGQFFDFVKNANTSPIDRWMRMLLTTREPEASAIPFIASYGSFFLNGSNRPLACISDPKPRASPSAKCTSIGQWACC